MRNYILYKCTWLKLYVVLELPCNWFMCAFPLGKYSIKSCSGFRIAHAVKFVRCYQRNHYAHWQWISGFFVLIWGLCPAGMTLVHRNSMDARFMVTVIPAFFICPNAVKGFEDISNMKGRSKNESNRQSQKECGNSEAAILQYRWGKETSDL